MGVPDTSDGRFSAEWGDGNMVDSVPIVSRCRILRACTADSCTVGIRNVCPTSCSSFAKMLCGRGRLDAEVKLRRDKNAVAKYMLALAINATKWVVIICTGYKTRELALVVVGWRSKQRVQR
jgi:hypothetical protein